MLLSGCAARAATPTLPTTPELPAATLARELRSLFTNSAAERAHWAVSFYSLRRAEMLYSLNPSRLMVPASIQKMLTSAVAAEQLGWDYRYTTRVLSTAPITAEGNIQGDLIVVGSGDPSINPRHPERWRAFDDWAAALKAQGLKIVQGRLIGDDNAFAEPAWGYGWSWDDLHHGYGAEPAALQFNENSVEVMVGPAIEAGRPAIISTSPIGSGLTVDVGVTTVAAGQQTLIEMSRMPGSTFLSVRGQIAVDARPITLDASAENPTRFFVTALREALSRHGIFVAGGVADLDELRTPVATDGLHELIVDRSPPLSELIDVTLKWSRNIYAETMLLSIAAAGQPANGARGVQTLRDVLRKWGVGDELFLARDGSGLSRYNYVTADAMVALLTYLWRDPRHAELFQAALPVAGVSGTLANRMKATPAEGRVMAKTGTMSHVRSLSGYVTTLEGEPFAFSMVANDFRIPAVQIDAIMDTAEANGKRPCANTLEHGKAGAQADRGHRRSEENARRPEIADLIGQGVPCGGIPYSECRTVCAKRRIADRAHQSHRHEPDDECGNERLPAHALAPVRRRR
jgi:PBP4 family serine-type D-alanyl-D-alanine carboxypeptidase